MVKCPKCNKEYYELLFIEDYDYVIDEVIVTGKAKCDHCGEEFWVQEKFNFVSAKNMA